MELECAEDEIYPLVNQEALKKLVIELKNKESRWHHLKVHSLYSHAHRKALLQLLNAFIFKTNSPKGRDLLDAIAFIKKNQESTDTYYPDATLVPTANVIPASWKSMVFETNDFPVTATAVVDTIKYDSSTGDTEKQASSIKINRFHIDWQPIEDNYDEYVKHVSALKTGTVDPDVLIKKFSKKTTIILCTKRLLR